MNALTMAALVVMAICAIRGWRRGFVMLLYGIAAWVFIAVFVLIAHRFIYNYFMGNEMIYTKVYDFARPYVNKYVPESILDVVNVENVISKATEKLVGDVDPETIKIDNDFLSNIDADRLADYGIEIPEEYRGVVESMISKAAEGVDKGSDAAGELIENAKERAGDAGEDLRNAMVDAATQTAVEYIFRAAAVFTAYLIAKIICVIVKIVLIVITERTPIRMAVHLAGAALGWFESVLYIWVALYVIRALEVTSFGRSLASQIDESSLLISLDSHNMLSGFLSFLLGF